MEPGTHESAKLDKSFVPRVEELRTSRMLNFPSIAVNVVRVTAMNVLELLVHPVTGTHERPVVLKVSE